MNGKRLPLLACVLLVCATLCGCGAKRQIQEDKAVAEISQLGAVVECDEESRGKPVIRVSFTDPQVADADIERLKGFAQLQTLYLNGTQVTDAGLKHLEGFTKLQHLGLKRTRITDAGLVHLKGLTQLRWLVLDGTKVTDAGLAHLKGLTQLQTLHVNRTKVTEARVNDLQKALPDVRIER